MRAWPGRQGLRADRRTAEDEVHDEGEEDVEPIDQRHHDDDEDEHDRRVAHQLPTGRGDDLPQFGDHLAQEKRDATERTTGAAVFPGIRYDVLTRLVDDFS